MKPAPGATKRLAEFTARARRIAAGVMIHVSRTQGTRRINTSTTRRREWRAWFRAHRKWRGRVGQAAP